MGEPLDIEGGGRDVEPRVLRAVVLELGSIDDLYDGLDVIDILGQFSQFAENRLQVCLGDVADVPRVAEPAEALFADLLAAAF